MLEDLLEWIVTGILYFFKKDTTKYQYYQKKIMSDYEIYFYNIFKELENEFNIVVQPQIPLSAIVQRKNNEYTPNELFRVIDFGIFSSDYDELVLLIEINDKTHNTKKRRDRDRKVKKILENVNIPLITFYSNKSNEYNYVKNRLRENIIQSINDRDEYK